MTLNKFKALRSGMAAALGAVLILALIPQLLAPVRGKEPEAVVFQPEPIYALSQHNLVDALASLPLQLPLVRVEWRQSVLYVDLHLHDDTAEATVHADLLALLKLSFVQTDNVQRLLVRFLVPATHDTHPAHVLVAADVRAADFANRMALAQLGPQQLLEKEWKQRLRITYGPLWKQRKAVP